MFNRSKGLLWQAPLILTWAAGPNAALLTLPDLTLFTAPTGSAWEVVDIAEIHETLGTDGGAVSLDLKKCTGTQAAGSGASSLLTVFNLKATINTVVRKNRSSGLSATKANLQISAGQRLALDFIGTMTSVSGVHVTVILIPTRRPTF